MMSRVILTEYDAEHQALKLPEPLAGFKDRYTVPIVVDGNQPADRGDRPWMKYAGSFKGEAGRELAAAVREAFGRDEIEV